MKLYKHFRLKKGKYIDDDGNELDTNYIVSRSHYIQEDFGFVEFEYAAPIRAEVERLKEKISELEPPQSVLDIMRANQHHRATIDQLEYQLSAANQRIAELEEQNKKYWFMIEHGLGVEDITPPTYPHP